MNIVKLNVTRNSNRIQIIYVNILDHTRVAQSKVYGYATIVDLLVSIPQLC